MTLAEFLAWEERQDLRYEFDGFKPIAMTGGTIAHDQITFDAFVVCQPDSSGRSPETLKPLPDFSQD